MKVKSLEEKLYIFNHEGKDKDVESSNAMELIREILTKEFELDEDEDFSVMKRKIVIPVDSDDKITWRRPCGNLEFPIARKYADDLLKWVNDQVVIKYGHGYAYFTQEGALDYFKNNPVPSAAKTMEPSARERFVRIWKGLMRRVTEDNMVIHGLGHWQDGVRQMIENRSRRRG